MLLLYTDAGDRLKRWNWERVENLVSYKLLQVNLNKLNNKLHCKELLKEILSVKEIIE